MNSTSSEAFMAATAKAAAAIAEQGAPPSALAWRPDELDGLSAGGSVRDLPHDRFDPAERAVVVAALWRDAVRPRYSGNDEDDTDEIPAGRFDVLRDYLDLVTVSEVRPVSLVWEIEVAGAAGARQRLLQLVDRLASVDAESQSNLAICTWNLFQLVVCDGDGHERPWGATPWNHDRRLQAVWQWIATCDVAALVLRHAGMSGVEPKRATTQVPRTLQAALENRLVQLESLCPLPPPLRGARVASAFLSALTDGSHRAFEGLASRLEEHVVEIRSSVPELYQGAEVRWARANAALLRLAGTPQLAAEALQQVASLHPNDDELWREMAVCADAAGNTALALQAVENVSADRPDVVSRLAMTFGHSKVQAERKLERIDEILWNAAGRGVDLEMLAVVQPFTRGLSELAKHKWYTAVRLASLPEVRELAGGFDGVSLSIRAALEIDIKDKLVGFVRTAGVSIDLGHGNLGNCLFWLTTVADRTDASNRAVAELFGARYPGLMRGQNLRRFIQQSHKVRLEGNDGAHARASEGALEALAVASDCLAFLYRVCVIEARDAM